MTRISGQVFPNTWTKVWKEKIVEFKQGDIISAYDEHLVLKYIGNNAGTILFVSQEFSDKNDLPKSQGVGAIWAIADLSIFKENNAWMKFHKLDCLYGRN